MMKEHSFNLDKSNLDICKECGGKCCTILCIISDKDDKNEFEFFKTRLNPDEYSIATYGNNRSIYFKHKCPYFDEQTGLCTIYENRPSVCRNFPDRYDISWVPVCPLMRKMKPKKPYRVLKKG